MAIAKKITAQSAVAGKDKKSRTAPVRRLPKKVAITKPEAEKKTSKPPVKIIKEVVKKIVVKDQPVLEEIFGAEEEKLAIKGLKLKYIEAIGRRKTASSRVRLFTQGKKDITVNGKDYMVYFPVLEWQKNVEDPLKKLNCANKFGISIIVRGGGLSAQSEACRHGISRALVSLNPYFKKRLKKSGFLTRDSRMRERKKPGLKRARRAPQWSKR